jgi:hypothetical protein
MVPLNAESLRSSCPCTTARRHSERTIRGVKKEDNYISRYMTDTNDGHQLVARTDT